MARIRTIKPELPHDSDLARVSLQARLAFIYLITISDDHGYFRATLRYLNGALFPHDEEVTEDVLKGWLGSLKHIGVIEVLHTKDGPLGHIVNWARHQRIDKPIRSYLAERAGAPLLSDTPTYVYAFRRSIDGAIKIGRTDNLVRRATELAGDVGVPLEFLGCTTAPRKTERQAHQRFVKHRLGVGEWYKPDPELLAWIQETLTDPMPTEDRPATGPRPARDRPATDEQDGREEMPPRSTGVQEYRSTGPKSSSSADADGRMLPVKLPQVITDVVKAGTVRRKQKEQALGLAAEVLFVYWSARFGHPRAVLDKKRQRRLEERLRENGGDVDELLDTVDGALRDDYITGRDPKAPRAYDGIETIYRDRAQVERFVQLARVKREPGQHHPFIAQWSAERGRDTTTPAE